MPTTAVNETTLSYVEEGHGVPVVFVHGGMADQRVWEHQLDQFGVHHRAIAVSCRGSWPNDKPQEGEKIGVDTHADDLVQFIRNLDVGPVTSSATPHPAASAASWSHSTTRNCCGHSSCASPPRSRSSA